MQSINDQQRASFVQLIADGSATHGYGHISRSREVADAFSESGFEVEFINLLERPSATLIDHGKPGLVIIDLPYPDDTWLNLARRRGNKVIGLDYLGQGSPDCLVRMNQPLTPIPCGRLFFGLEYAIIRKSVRDATPSRGVYALVSIGGADVGNHGFTAATTLSTLGLKTVLVRGPLSQDIGEAAADFTIVESPPDFSGLLARSSWVVSNGGTTMVEAMSLGKAVYVIPQTSEEERFARPLGAAGLLLGVGSHGLRVPTEDEIVSTGRRARKAVDTRGSERIVKLGQQLLGQKHFHPEA
ncbi:hypothetical protein [Bradyrhizobium sp. G127]|uniref:glycosyltransferase n=1 Tax=Bradyrhizobium sp. G127 TaxID=2904800 RepID=UPI001F2661D1|nr:hypothetical protein [Bradyrhizobium sp. G127]MCF2524454.1 hypothetical protein [Bradyrhizobium sp. G127]